ncbi:MAG: DUF58 domain-containing protein [Thiotrichaceae bacterium]
MLKAQRDHWLQNRFPVSNQITLSLNKIFIIPTVTSVALLATIALLFLMAINFQNALVYGLSFWLLALTVVTIFFTYRNLSGLTIKSIQSTSCFAGEKAVFELQVSCSEHQKKSAIFLGWKDEDVAEVSLQQEHTRRIKLSHSTKQRGYFKPPKVNIFTRYPIGLIISWSYAALDMQSIVYPAPKLQDSAEGGQSKDDQAAQGTEIANGSTDFSGIREYQAGDSPKHIHWGTYAKTGEVYTKSFVDYASNDLWIDWDAINIGGVETKLSHLCAQILEYHQAHLTYGLKLPGKTIQPANSEAHKNICLTALALYGIDDSEMDGY